MELPSGAHRFPRSSCSRECTGNHDLGRISGIVVVITAAAAWYTSAAGVINGMKDPVLPSADLWAGALAAPLPRVD